MAKTEDIELTVTATLGKYGTAADVEDEALWDDLRDRIRELCRDNKYFDIAPVVR